MKLTQPPSIMLAAALLLAGCGASGPITPPVPAREDALETPLTGTPGEAVRGRQIVIGRDGNCLLCHAIPETGERFMGNVGPPLSGVAMRLNAGQLRLRVVDPTRINPDAVMPAYHRVDRLDQVVEPFRGKPVLSAQQIEDVVAYLLTLN